MVNKRSLSLQCDVPDHANVLLMEIGHSVECLHEKGANRSDGQRTGQ